jgi:phosphoglycolate phosphatase
MSLHTLDVGNGAMVGAIVGSTKREPTVVGKPSDFMLENIATTFKLQKEQICMVSISPIMNWQSSKSQSRQTCFLFLAVSLQCCVAIQVGDRLDTDIMFGKNGGLTTALVLSGKLMKDCAFDSE